MVAVIRSLRSDGLPCYLATNQEHYRVEYMRAHMGFADLFDGLFYSAAIGCKKPDARFYEHIQQALGLPGEAILFWDDALANVEAARACGWHAEHYTGFEELRRRMCAYGLPLAFGASAC